MVNLVGGNPGEGENVVQDSLEGIGRLGGVDVDLAVAGAGELTLDRTLKLINTDAMYARDLKQIKEGERRLDAMYTEHFAQIREGERRTDAMYRDMYQFIKPKTITFDEIPGKANEFKYVN